MIPPKTPHMSKARADARAFDMKALRNFSSPVLPLNFGCIGPLQE